MPGADRAHAAAAGEWASVDPSVMGPGRCAKCYDWTLFFKTSQLKSDVFLVTRAQQSLNMHLFTRPQGVSKLFTFERNTHVKSFFLWADKYIHRLQSFLLHG